MNLFYVPNHVVFDSYEECQEKYPYQKVHIVICVDDYLIAKEKMDEKRNNNLSFCNFSVLVFWKKILLYFRPQNK